MSLGVIGGELLLLLDESNGGCSLHYELSLPQIAVRRYLLELDADADIDVGEAKDLVRISL